VLYGLRGVRDVTHLTPNANTHIKRVEVCRSVQTHKNRPELFITKQKARAVFTDEEERKGTVRNVIELDLQDCNTFIDRFDSDRRLQ
jgi:hypothetical protein